MLPSWHILTEHCTNYYCHFASNVPVVTNANVLQMSVIRGSQIQLNAGWDQNVSVSSNNLDRLSKILQHQLFAFP